MKAASAGSRRWWALGAVCLSVLAGTLDATVLSVALPTLAGALHASESELEWFSSGYLMLLAAAVLPAGLIGDRFGRKKLLVGCLVAFGAGSVLCAEATSPGVFLVARLILGLAVSGVTVMAMSALTVLFSEGDRAKAVGIYEAANFIGLPAGPLLGGWMLSRFWWGWVFLLNAPIVILGLVAVIVLVPESRAEQRPGLDPIGIASSTAGLIALISGLIQAGQDGWRSINALALIAAGLTALAGFLGWERRLGRRNSTPLIDPGLFRSASFRWGTLLGGVAGLAMIGTLFAMPQYFQAVRDATALNSGLRQLPLIAGLVIGAIPAGALSKSVGAKLTVTLGFVILGAGAAVGATTDTNSTAMFAALWMLALGVGTGVALSAATAAALSHLSAERSGTGSAVVQAFQHTAAPLGTAVMGSVLAAGFRANLRLPGIPPAAAHAAQQSVYAGLAAASKAGAASLEPAVRSAFTSALDAALLISAGIAVAGALLSLAYLPRRATMTESAGSQPRPGLRERKKARTRARIQASAMGLFRVQGFDATTIEQIIEASEVSETTFFRYFPVKEDVVLDIDYDSQLLQALAAQPAEASVAQALRASFAATFAGRSSEQLVEQQERIALMATNQRLRAAMLSRVSQAMQVLAAAIAERVGRAEDDFDVLTVAGAIVGAAMAVSVAVTDDPSADLPALIDRALRRLEPALAL